MEKLEENKLLTMEKRNREYIMINKPLVYNKIMNYPKMIAEGKITPMVQIQPAYECNFKCNHCMSTPFMTQKRPKLTPADYKNIFNQLDEYGLAQADMSGGEPLMLPNLKEILEAIDLKRFYMAIATNAWFLTKEKAEWLKIMGVDRMLLSLDSLDEKKHDEWRHKPGSYKRVIAGMKYVKDAGLDLKITSLITRERVHSDEFRDFMKFLDDNGTRIEALPPRPAGEYALRKDILLSSDDIKFLEDTYGIQFHTSVHFGKRNGCCAVKKLLSINAFGDVIACQWIYYSLGNLLKMSFKDIAIKGMKYFGEYHATCRVTEDMKFIDNYFASTKGKTMPLPVEEAIW